MSEQTTLQNDTEVQQPEPTDRREVLAAAFDNAEAVTAEQRARDEAGRFAPKQEKQEPAKPEPVAPAPEPVKPRLTTWKKEYLPLADKLAQGIPLTPEEARKLDAYNIQREQEYATGVSVHKERAQRLESVEKAIEPFMPELQKRGIPPDQWIANLGKAHHTLAMGTPQQKLQMFQKLANDYGVPLGAVQQTQNGQEMDPAVLHLMEQIQQLSGQVQAVTGWREQQQQQQVTSLLKELENDAENYPHFSNEKVRGAMAQLLESGSAQDLKEAYREAEWMVPEVRAMKLESLSQGNQATATQQAAKQVVNQAKAKNVQVRSSAPSGTVVASVAKDRRTLIAEQFDAITGRV